MKPRLSFANVTSMLALFVALGGTSYAAVTLSANSVNKTHLRTNSVGKSEIRTRAVGQSEVASNSIGASELRTSAVGSNDVKDETLGANDLAPAARTALADINGVTFRASVTAAGARAAGNVAASPTPRQRRVHGRDRARRERLPVLGRRHGREGRDDDRGADRRWTSATAVPSATATQVIVRTYDAANARGRLAVQPAHRLLTSGRRPAPGGAAAPSSEYGTSA